MREAEEDRQALALEDSAIINNYAHAVLYDDAHIFVVILAYVVQCVGEWLA